MFVNLEEKHLSGHSLHQYDLLSVTPLTMVRKYQVLQHLFFFWGGADKLLTRSFHINSLVSFFLLGQSPQKRNAAPPKQNLSGCVQMTQTEIKGPFAHILSNSGPSTATFAAGEGASVQTKSPRKALRCAVFPPRQQNQMLGRSD